MTPWTPPARTARAAYPVYLMTVTGRSGQVVARGRTEFVEKLRAVGDAFARGAAAIRIDADVSTDQTERWIATRSITEITITKEDPR